MTAARFIKRHAAITEWALRKDGDIVGPTYKMQCRNHFIISTVASFIMYNVH